MRRLALIPVLLFPGLGLAISGARPGRVGMVLRLLALGFALAEALHVADWLIGLGRIHLAGAALGWLLPLIFGVASRRAKGPATGARGLSRQIPRAPASS